VLLTSRRVLRRRHRPIPGDRARHGYYPLRGVAVYQDIYKLTYVRGPSGILVILAEELTKN